MKFKEEQFRTDKDDFYKISGLFDGSALNHHPFIVFNDGIVELCENSKNLLLYPPETVVLGQWQGNWSSDWFKFTVADYMAYLIKNK